MLQACTLDTTFYMKHVFIDKDTSIAKYICHVSVTHYMSVHLFWKLMQWCFN